MMTDSLKTVRVRITGLVQGVGFRRWTQKTAQGLALQGWVRNLSTGAVEALFHGAPGNVEKMLVLCKTGAGLSRVDKVECFEDIYDGTDDFTMKETL